MSTYALSLLLVVIVVTVAELLLYAWRGARAVSLARTASRRLREHSWEKTWDASSGDILKSRVLSTIPPLNALLAKIDIVGRLELLLRQARVFYPPAAVLMMSGLLAATAFLAGELALRNRGTALLCAAAAGLLPFAWLKAKKAARMKKFETQLPEALDLIARSLKAGHAFTSSLKVAADSFGDPLGTEFGDTINEINFGLAVPDALKNMGRRVESPDLRYFIVATILQRETGGNLAEITQNIARIIRERFKFHDKVRVLAAEGKISAAILIALPFVMFFVILKLNPDYVEVLLQEPVGKKALAGAVGLMLCGIGVILKMIKINL